MNIKIKSQKEIIAITKALRSQGKKIVVFNGSFDVLHVGHIRSIKEAKRQGDVLIILLNSDNSVKSYKGPKHPIYSQEARSEILSSLEYVDFICIFNEITPREILDKIRPDIYCHGEEWGKKSIESETVEKYGGKIHLLKRTESTSNIIKKILDLYSKPEARAVFLDRDGTINANEPEYVHKIEDFTFIPGALSALKNLSQTEYKIIIITNQSGIARDYYKEKDFKILNDWMLKEFKENGIRIDKVYFCPHGADDGCLCRKPEIGMFLEAARDFKINLSKSWVIGDETTDIVAGRNANVKTIKIGSRMPKNLKLEPNYYAKNLSEAVKIIQKIAP